ncbi:19142_t:CDS:2, partial [Rhizophagus irregularis]
DSVNQKLEEKGSIKRKLGEEKENFNLQSKKCRTTITLFCIVEGNEHNAFAININKNKPITPVDEYIHIIVSLPETTKTRQELINKVAELQKLLKRSIYGQYDNDRKPKFELSKLMVIIYGDEDMEDRVKKVLGHIACLKQVLKEYNSSKILPGTYPLTDEDEEEYTNNKSLPGTYPLKDDDEKLPQSVGKIKLLKSEQESTNDKISILPPLFKKSIGTQTTNFSADQKSLTYLIQGLISRSLSHFPLNEWVFINNTTKGVCRISSVEPRLSSVSLYCEYELGKVYTHHYSPAFSGYPIALKSPFSPSERIITGLDESKTKFIDNINYVIEFTEMLDFVEPVKSSSNISSSSTAVSSTKTIATQTRPYVEDTKELTYIAKGIMFKSICWFTWDEQEAFRLGKKKGILRLFSR